MPSKLTKIDLMSDLVMPIGIMMFLYPNYFMVKPMWSKLIMYSWKILLIVCVYYFFRYCVYKNKYFIMWFCFLLWIAIVSLINSGGINNTQIYKNYFGVLVITVYGVKKCPKKFIFYTATIMTTWILLNTLLWRPGGTYITANGQAGFFLGTKTSLTEYQLLGCCCVVLLYFISNGRMKIWAKILSIVMLVSLIVWNVLQPVSTSVICMIIFWGLVWTINSKLAIVDIIIKNGFLFTVLLNIGVVFFHIQNIFAGIIENGLGEDLTLNNRIYIWEVVLSKIKDSPIIGHGTETKTIFAIDHGISRINQSTHNCLLYLLFTVGIIGTIYFFTICFWTLKKAGTDSICGRVICITLIAFGFLWISEQLKTYNMFMICMILGMYVGQLDNKKIDAHKIKI